jgi:hypothetical protein
MNEEQLVFGPSILRSDGKRFMEITWNGKIGRLVLIELMKRHSSIAGWRQPAGKITGTGTGQRRSLVSKTRGSTQSAKMAN